MEGLRPCRATTTKQTPGTDTASVNAQCKDIIPKNVDPQRIAESMGIVVYREHFKKAGMDDWTSTHLHGFHAKQAGLEVIAVNTRFRRRSQRVTLAHELGHAVCHSGTDRANFRTAGGLLVDPAAERQADRFAARLLTCQVYVRIAVRELGNDPATLARFFDVPVGFMRDRLTELRLI
jgi:Zn-dependent peptidase ImmA (M78 family)